MTEIEMAKLDFVLHLGDTALILCQRLGEWCGHGPVLEQDIALTNIALDQVGLARMLYQYASELKNDGSTEDFLAYHRDAGDYKNNLLVELPNGNWGKTILRQFLHDAWHLQLYLALMKCPDQQLAGIAERTVKEINYHLRFSSEWVIRLGDGTDESHSKMVDALNELWPFQGEHYMPSSYEKLLINAGQLPDYTTLEKVYYEKVSQVLETATLPQPDRAAWMQTKGKTGVHTEHLGFILAEMQSIQRAHPNNVW